MRNKQYLPIGKHAQYDAYHWQYDESRLNSQILNSGGLPTTVQTIVDWTPQAIQREINIMIGDGTNADYPEMYVGSDGRPKLGSIPTIEVQLHQIQEEFQRYQTTRMNLGERKPTEMPADLLEKRLRTEARKDVMLEELEELKKRLKIFSDKAKESEDKKVLEFGPTGDITIHGFSSPNELIGSMKTIAGQTVGKLKTGELFIDDTRSPYDGMLVSDYKDYINKPWQEALLKRRAEKLAVLQDEARAKHELVPDSLPANLLALHRYAKKDLPPWPAGVKNCKELASVDDSDFVRKRKSLVL